MAIISIGTRPETGPLLSVVPARRAPTSGLKHQVRATPPTHPESEPAYHSIIGGVISSDACTMYRRTCGTLQGRGELGDDGWRGCVKEGRGRGVQGGVVVSSDQHRPWAVIPGLAQHPQAAGQTHTQFVTTPAGRLVRGSTCGFRVDFHFDHPHILWDVRREMI